MTNFDFDRLITRGSLPADWSHRAESRSQAAPAFRSPTTP